MQEAVTKANTPGKNALTGDGVHMALPGNKLMANGILKSLGLTEAQLNKANEAWLDLPNTASLKCEAKFSEREMQKLEKSAAARNSTPQKILDEEFQKAVESLKK